MVLYHSKIALIPYRLSMNPRITYIKGGNNVVLYFARYGKSGDTKDL